MSEINILYLHITDLHNSSIPKRIGAYVITHTFDNIHAEKYVGSTKNLFKRTHEHCNKEIIHVDLYITDDIYLAECLERVLMELVNPATNKRMPSLSDNDKELMNELLEDTNIKEHLLNNIIKIGCRYLKYVTKDEKQSFLSKGEYLTTKTEIKTLMETQWNRKILLSKRYLDIINFKAGKYEVTYEKDKITISKINKDK